MENVTIIYYPMLIFSAPPAEFWNSPIIRPRLLPFKHFPSSLIILPFEAIYSGRLTVVKFAIIDWTWEQLKNCDCATVSDRHVLDNDKYEIGVHNTAMFFSPCGRG